MGLGDILSGLTGAATGVEAGIANRRELERRARMDLLAQQLRDAQIANFYSEIQHRAQPVPRNIDPLSPEGIQAAIDKAKALQQYQTPKPTRPLVGYDKEGNMLLVTPPSAPGQQLAVQPVPGAGKPLTDKERTAGSQAASIEASVDRMGQLARDHPRAVQEAMAAIKAGHYPVVGRMAQDLKNFVSSPEGQEFFTEYSNYLLAVTPTYGGARPTQQLLDLETNASLPGLAAGGSALDAALTHMRARVKDVQAKAGRGVQSSTTPKAPAPKTTTGAPGYNPKFWNP